MTIVDDTALDDGAVIAPHELLADLAAALDPADILTEPDAIDSYRSDLTRTLAAAPPFAVVTPRSIEQVQAIARAATRHRVPLVVRGAGTGLSGAATAPAGGIVLSTAGLTGIRIDVDDHVAVVGPGAITDHVDAAARAHGLMYAPDPASSAWSTIGGNIATNAGGLRCVKYGVTRDAVLGLDVVLADGRRVQTGHRSVKGVTGYDLTSLLVGSEGTLGIIVGATLRLVPAPLHVRTLVVSVPSLREAGRAVGVVTGSGVRPSCVELLDRASLENIDTHSGTDLVARHGDGLVLVQTDGPGASVEIDLLGDALAAAGLTVRVLDDAAGAWYYELRRTGRGYSGDDWSIGEDIAVPRSKLVDILATIQDIATRHDLAVQAVAHAGDGNLHPGFSTPRRGGETRPPARLAIAADELIRAALAMGGTISGEHGIGSLKRGWLEHELGATQIELQREVKRAFDPLDLLAPDGFLGIHDDDPTLPGAVPESASAHAAGAETATEAQPAAPDPASPNPRSPETTGRTHD
ncbi:FAD-binding oxidoreductase [Microbacterium rhizomatis]|uniref:FAD-binding protein n=1 Tax=Microbacterium rhizomatis TaxID=1631477 RepID=A0A5J5J135_9MICO|nr:FAD-linked oxidase C-terminal domain-containing protein [Microbacterium rhizomatis]KAA9106373.1 FAD-binding protein [Microbacterium rhizomatis]